MNLTKRLILGALIISLIGYLGGAFMLWDLNHGNWTFQIRGWCLGIILAVFFVFGGVSLEVNEEKKLEKKFINKEFEHTDIGKVKVIRWTQKTEEDDSKTYLISYKRIKDGKVFDENYLNLKKESTLAKNL